MCGIAGYIGKRAISDETAARCLKRMQHRGPDACGAYRHVLHDDWQVCLLHTRLSIIGLAPRVDPYCRASCTIAFNGEIYNYVELKQGLVGQGERFATAGDTEVLIAGLNRHGLDWLDAVEGMWAFAYYDEDSGALALSRDRFGEKPLYIMAADDGWYFGSEVKFLAALAGRQPEINRNHLRRYLVNGYKSLYKTEETFYHGVGELRSGHLLTLRPGHPAEQSAYWRPARAREAHAMSFADAAAATRERLIDSVRLRLRADVPIAFCMSGGVDSNSLISIAKRVFGYDVHGFTVANTDSRYEERDAVETVVRELGIRHTMLPLSTDDFLGNLRRLVAHHDAPVYTISYYVHWLLMRKVAECGYKICVSGTAADELFTGYFDHHNAYLAEVSDDVGMHAEALANWRTHIRPVVRNPHLQDADLMVRDRDFRDHIYLGAETFAAALREPWQEPFAEEDFAPSVLRNRMLNELFHESVPVILHEDDINAMYYSIENRSPFLDRRLFEFAQSIPTRHLVRDGYAKAVLREAMRGIVPDAVIDTRRKVGFNAPLLELLDTTDARVREAAMAQGAIFEMVRRDFIEGLLAKNALPNSESKFLFNFLCARMFLEQCGADAGTR